MSRYKAWKRSNLCSRRTIQPSCSVSWVVRVESLTISNKSSSVFTPHTIHIVLYISEETFNCCNFSQPLFACFSMNFSSTPRVLILLQKNKIVWAQRKFGVFESYKTPCEHILCKFLILSRRKFSYNSRSFVHLHDSVKCMHGNTCQQLCFD